MIKKINLNLASEPLRNRRFYRLLFWVLIGIFLCVSCLSAFLFLSYRQRGIEAKIALAQVSKKIQAAQKERNEFNRQIQRVSRKNKEKFDFINIIILKKSFSWVDFFSRLEKALPASSYILTFSPLEAGERRIDLRFKVVSASLNTLLELIRNLNASNFKNITVKNEAKEAGVIISEISLSYERTG